MFAALSLIVYVLSSSYSLAATRGAGGGCSLLGGEGVACGEGAALRGWCGMRGGCAIAGRVRCVHYCFICLYI